MVILKVKIKRNQTSSGTKYTYPPEYDPRKIQVLCYESMLPENYAEVVSRGNKDEYLIGCVSDGDADVFLKSKDIQEISETEAKILGEAWTRRATKITDPEKVIAVLAKSVRGETLTQTEKDSIDPNKPDSGIILSKSFTECLDELKIKI